MMSLDDLYDYSTFSKERIKEIFYGWDGLGGYHGLLIKKAATLVTGKSVLDVGCGLCHLYEGLKEVGYTGIYAGVENHPIIYEMAKERYEYLPIYQLDFYNLYELLNKYDSVYAIGLYREEPNRKRGISSLVAASNRVVILTYFARQKGVVPSALRSPDWSVEFIDHTIDPRLEIVRMWRRT